MAKKKTKITVSPAATVPAVAARPVDLALQPKWSFETRSRCPRCGGTQTLATSTQGNVQYRKCLAPICQKRYTVFGKKV